MRRLGDAAVDEIAVTDHAVTLRRGNETCIVEVVASADLAGTGVEGLVVRITGTASQQRYAILQPDEAGALRPMAQSILLATTGLGPTSEHGNSF